MTRRLAAACLALLVGIGNAGERIAPLDARAFAAELEQRRGNVLLVNFWATWCRPCLEEIPALMELEAELGERGFELVAVSLDDAGAADTVIGPFLDKWFPDFETYLSVEGDMDTMVGVIDPYWNEVLPTSYVIAPDGSMAKRIQGGSSAEEFAAAIAPFLD